MAVSHKKVSRNPLPLFSCLWFFWCLAITFKLKHAFSILQRKPFWPVTSQIKSDFDEFVSFFRFQLGFFIIMIWYLCFAIIFIVLIRIHLDPDHVLELTKSIRADRLSSLFEAFPEQKQQQQQQKGRKEKRNWYASIPRPGYAEYR